MHNLFATEFGLENEDPTLPVVEAPEQIAEAAADDQVMADQEACLEELETAIELTEQQADALTTVVEQIEEAQAEGGMSDQTATMAAVAVECALAPFAGAIKIQMPATESYGVAGARLTQTTYALEAIGQRIADMWRAIKEFVKKWFNKVVEWFASAFTTAGRLESSAKALSKKAEEKVGSPKQKTVELSGGAFRYLSTDLSKLAPTSELEGVTAALKTGETKNSALEASKKYLAALKEVSVENYGKGTVAKIAKMTDFELAGSLMGIALVENKEARFAGSAKTYVESGSRAMLGNKTPVVRYTVTDIEEDGQSYAFEAARFSIEDFNTKAALKDTYTVNALDKAGIVAVADEVARLAAAARKQQDIAKIAKAEVDKAQAQLDRISAQMDKATDEQKKSANYKAMRVMIRDSAKVMPMTVSATYSLTGYALNVGKAWLGFASKCLSNIGE